VSLRVYSGKRCGPTTITATRMMTRNSDPLMPNTPLSIGSPDRPGPPRFAYRRTHPSEWGPQRWPGYTRKLTQMVRQLRVFLDNARSQIAEEVGPEMADLDLSTSA